VPIAKSLISNNTFNFDLLANSRGSASEEIYTRIAWNNMNNTSVVGKGIGYLSDEYANHADEPISTEAGAGTRLTAPAGLRFESRVNKAKYDAAIASGAQITTGTLIVPTDYLTEYGINNSNFTKENLDLLGVNYLDVVNDGWAKEVNGEYVYYGSIVGIKTQNFDRNFSGIGYMTVKTDTEEYTVYAGYRAADHSRSVQYVATAAIASGEYNDYLTVLQSFIKTSAPARAEGTTYRVMQYNLMKDGEGWGGSALEIPYLASSVRKNITSAAIEGYAPDVIVINERFDDTWADLGLSEKYVVIGDSDNRNAIVYNKDVFEEVTSGSKPFTEADGTNNRNVSYAILKDGEQMIAVFATHWGTDSAKHASQLSDMQACMGEVLTGDYANIPVVILGDFNTLKNGTGYTALLGETYTDAVTSATSVDHIAVKGFEVVGQGMDTQSYTKFASDHKPIYADIAIVEIGG
ncbi:MAG: endonuclease/exonuclease/phosphatase family protein, partial [Clostridia bacterium]|nr:endonuclease/exonuclease/phosphatase family protein [Clostridia bacterium]